MGQAGESVVEEGAQLRRTRLTVLPPDGEVVARGPHVGNTASGHTAPSSLRTLGDWRSCCLTSGHSARNTL